MTAVRERVLITGGSGFLGACLARDRVAAGDEVHLTLRPTSDPWRLAGLEGRYAAHRADLTDAASLRRAAAACRPDVIYHLAGYGVYPHQQDRAALLATNVLGLANLFDALGGRDYRALVCAGTCLEYGPRAGPIREDERLAPETPYAAAKAAAALLCRAEAARGRPVVVVRVFAAYGPWEGAGRLVPYVMECCRRGRPPRVTAGRQVRDFVHADDVVALLRAAAASPAARGQVLHAGTGRPHAVREMVETVLAVCDSRVSVEYGAAAVRPGEPPACVADIARTTALTGWRPRLDLRAGVERTWAWFRAATPRAA